MMKTESNRKHTHEHQYTQTYGHTPSERDQRKRSDEIQKKIGKKDKRDRQELQAFGVIFLQ